MLYNNIPDELKALPNWVVWQYEHHGGRRTKVPYNAITRQRAKSNDPATWNTWEEVTQNAPKWAHGVGFMFSESPYIGVDIDHCLDGGEKEKAAVRLVEMLGTYAEVSPSGEGLHMIGRAELERGFRNKDIEVYPSGRYFTVTGDIYQGYSAIEDIQDQLLGLLDAEKSATKPETAQMQNYPNTTQTISNNIDEVIERIRRSRQAGLFSALFDRGDVSLYDGDDSSADIALMNMLPFWTGGDIPLMIEIFSRSALAQREKWSREDYRMRTAKAAIKTWNGKTYKGSNRVQETIAECCKGEKIPTELIAGLMDYDLTDLGNAERLKHLYRDKCLYVEENGHWYTWTGQKWAQESGKEGIPLYDKASNALRLTYALAEDTFSVNPAADKDEEKRRAHMLSYFKKSQNLQPTKNCISRARTLFLTSVETFDENPYLLNCPNGTVDLRTGELKPHDLNDHITMVTRAAYNPGKKSDMWEYVLQSVIPDVDMRKWLKRFIGYSLYGLTSEEKFLFLYGHGGSGKGTFIESIGHVLGDYAGTMDIDTILTARNDAGDGGQATPQLAKLVGKRLILTSESGAGRKFNSARLKLITGGDRITARFLHGNPFEFSPQFTLVMSSNYKPALTDTTDEGMRRRLVIAPFDTVLEQKDITLKYELKTNTDITESILAWCVEGAQEWYLNGLGETPARIKKVMGDYYTDNDIIGQFIDECCVTGEGCREKPKTLLRAFNEWLEEGRGVTLRTFTDQMEARGYRRKHTEKGNILDKITLKDDFRGFIIE